MKERASRFKKEFAQRAQAEADADRLEKLNDEIFKKEEELTRNKEEYLGEKRLNQEILEPHQSIPTKDMPGSYGIMMCSTNDMTLDFPKKFGEYKRTVDELERMLADRGDPEDDIKRTLVLNKKNSQGS